MDVRNAEALALAVSRWQDKADTIRERRASDLTPDEVEALRWARVQVSLHGSTDTASAASAIAVLDKLTRSR